MKKSLYTLTLFVALCSALGVSAKDITPSEAGQIADRFFRGQRVAPLYSTPSAQTPAVSLAYSGSVGADNAAVDAGTPYYVFNYGDAAFVLIAGDDRMMPVLGYSDGGAFAPDRIPDNVASWLAMYADEYAALQMRDEASTPQLVRSTQTSYPSAVSPLLGSLAWNQNAPYNAQCPLVGTTATYTGCVATAMSMLMKYHAYPTAGVDSVKTYTTSSQKLAVSYDFGRTIDWGNMLPTYTSGNYTDTQAEAVASLMLGCGVAVNMDYNTGSSGATSAQVTNGLINLYKYDGNVQYIKRDFYDYSEWLALIKNELTNARPIFYAGRTTTDGHAFIFDGYNADDMVHVNWGWGGSYNGYFRLTGLHPEQVGIGGGNGDVEGFNYSQAMIVGIQKPSSESKYLTGFTVDAVEPSATTFTRSQSITFKMTNLTNSGSNFPGGNIALIFEKDGVQTVVKSASLSSLSTNYRWSSRSLSSVKVSTSIADGVYTAYLAVRPAGSSDPWSRVRCKAYTTGIWRATVSGNDVTLADYWGNFDVSGTLTVGSPLNPGIEATFGMTFSNLNTQTEVYTAAGVALVSQTSGATTVLDCGQIYLAPGATNESFEFPATLPDTLSAGSYSLIPVLSYGSNWVQVGQAVAGEVVAATISTSDGNLQTPIAITFENEVITEGDPVVLSFTLKNKSAQNVYKNKLTIYFYDYSTSVYKTGYYTSEITLASGASKTLSFTLSPTLTAGKYYVMLRGASTWLNYSKAAVFTVSAATGIDDVSADRSDAPAVTYLPQADVLRIAAPADARRAEVYDLSGRLVIAAPLTGEAVQVVDASHLPAGSYIVRLQGAGGVEVGRFVKP